MSSGTGQAVEARAPEASRSRYLHIAFWVGFSSLVYEVYSAKVLFLFFLETTHAVALTLSAFLAGLAFSSLYFSRRVGPANARAERLLVMLQVAAAVYALGILRQYWWIPNVVDAVTRTVGNRLGDAFKLVFVWVYLFFPGFFIGGAFPILTGLYLSSREAGTRDAGVVYFWDTLGAIVGALAAGFVLLPVLGLERAIVVPVAVNLVLAVVLIRSRNGKIYLAGAGVAACALALVLSRSLGAPETLTSNSIPALPKPRDPYAARFGTILFQVESPFGRITVGDSANQVPNNRGLFINYRDMCHSKMSESEQMLGELTTKHLEPNARVLNIGLGCGITAGIISRSPKVTALEIAEINPIVARASKEYFGEYNFRVLEQAKTELLIKDGAEVVRQTTHRYAAVVIDIEEPTIIYSSPLYTREYFQMIKEKLEPRGLLAVWALGSDPVYGKIIHNTLTAVFPNVYARIVSQHLQYYASERELVIPITDPSEIEAIRSLLSLPNREINTLDNRILERHFDIRRAFVLPKYYTERYFSSEEGRRHAPDGGK